jgi:predicted TIM-barrel enzyme
MATWGDINLVLNRLVREGVIAGFWTNLAEPRAALGMQVIVAPATDVDDAAALAIQELVRDKLARCAPEAVVTVDRSGEPLGYGSLGALS